jgi:hypothetical protein
MNQQARLRAPRNERQHVWRVGRIRIQFYNPFVPDNWACGLFRFRPQDNPKWCWAAALGCFDFLWRRA